MTAGKLVAVTVVGVDRPGIVAAITNTLFSLGCNLEDVSSTILRGHFSMMLVVKTPDASDAADLEQRLTDAGAPLGLDVSVRPVEAHASEPPQPTHMVSVYGADHPGIVARVAETLAARGANITDLTSRVIGEESAPVYAVMLEVELSGEGTVDELLSLREALDVEISVHPIEADLL